MSRFLEVRSRWPSRRALIITFFSLSVLLSLNIREAGAASQSEGQRWQVDHHFRDPLTAELTAAAVSTNRERFRIAIFRNKDSRVRITLSLPRGTFDQLPLNGRIAAYRPDDKEVSIIETPSELLRLERPWSDGKTVRALLWHGQGPSPTAGTLRDILDARVLTARFFIDRGAMIDTVFSLDGARDAIADATDINPDIDRELTQKAITARRLVTAATRRCTASAQHSACLDAALKCMPAREALFDEGKFRLCLTKMGWPMD